MRKNQRPHGPMPYQQGPMGQFPGRPPMMGQGMGVQPFQPFQQPMQPPFGEPYTADIPQITIEQVQMEIQPLVQYGNLQLNRIAMIGYLIGLGYSFEEARQMVESYLR